MGQEMAYRYQEQVIHAMIAALRAFRARCDGRVGAGSTRAPAPSRDTAAGE
jgi:hypothetical protein